MNHIQPDIRPSVCPLDCPDTCSLAVTVEDDRITAIHGSDANPYTASVICNKVARHYPEFVHGPLRLTRPLKRVGPRGGDAFEPISWDEAIDLIHTGFTASIEKHGPQSVAPFNYAGPHGELAGGSMDRRFFHKLGATLLDRGPLCGGVRGTAYTSLFGATPGMAPEQARDADLVVVWGNNVTVSNLHLIRILNDVKAKGGKVVVIDPKRIKAAEQADLHLAPKPGTDVVLALAVATALEARGALAMNFIAKWTLGFDEYMAEARKYGADEVADICEIDRADFEAFVDLYANAENVAVSLGNGIERGKSGGSGLRAAMALQALTGNHGRQGAGVIAKPGLAAPKTTAKLQRPDLIPAGTRTFNIVDMAEKLLDADLDTPLGAIMIYNHNPVACHPDQDAMIRALSRDDLFIAGADVAMTDSMKYCDVVLPAASHFEFADLYGAYGQNYVQRADPVIPCVGESLPNTEIFRRLAAQFGFVDPIFQESDAQLMDAAMDATDPRMGGNKPSEIPLDKALKMETPAGPPAIMCLTVAPSTPSGLIELYSQAMETKFGRGVPKFDPAPQDRPFVLISPSSDKRTNATFGGCAASEGLEILEINVEDAKRLGFKQGDVVRVSNDRGETALVATPTDAVRPGVLYSPKGAWLRNSPTGKTVNALIPSDVRVDIERGAAYNETFVDLALMEPA